jgi:hypothetical protein
MVGRVRQAERREGAELSGRIVNTIPSHDVVLRRVVDRVTADQDGGTADELAARLRPLYPRIAVFERQLSGERAHLYVYRDGRYEPERSDDWWAAPGTPCVHVSATTGLLSAVTGSFSELMRTDRTALVGRHFADFLLPAARAGGQAMFEAVIEARETRSEALVQRPDGTTVPIEFRAIRRGDEIEVCYRPLDSTA